MPSQHFVLKPEWQMLATFVPNKRLPVYNWFYYKEGFSRDLVMNFLREWRPQNVLDPFCGVGTTLVACKESGINAWGLDVSPVGILASKVKITDYDLEELKEAIHAVRKCKFKMPDRKQASQYVRRFFNIHTLDDVMFFRDFLKGNFSGGVYDFLLLGLISATSKCSYMYKDGAVIKVRKHPVPSFRKYYISLLNRMLWDLRKVQFRPCSISVAEGDARNLGVIGDGTIDAVITSPPYLNKIEYSRVYGIEELLFFSKPENSSIRSFIGLELDAPQMFPDMDLPPEANAYLADMKKVLEELYRVCSPGARLAFVIGTSWFGDKDDPQKSRHIECDVLLSRMAEELGFKTEAIYIVAERFFTIDRVIKIGKARESIVVLKK